MSEVSCDTSPIVADLESRFQGWRVWISDTGQWWASRRRSLTASQQQSGLAPHLTADTTEELAELITEQEDHPR